jgi:competence ComEA-like helix-hairpin-helix protein
MTPAERKAILFLGALALAGALARGARAWRQVPVSAASVQALDAQLAAVDSARQADSARKQNRKHPTRPSRRVTAREAGAATTPRAAAPPLRVDLDVATAAQIESLPGIGPALAQRLVAYRDSCGPYGEIARVDRVPGIGPAMLAKLAPWVTFSLPPRPDNAVPGDPGDRRRTNPQRAQNGRTRRLQRAHR